MQISICNSNIHFHLVSQRLGYLAVTILLFSDVLLIRCKFDMQLAGKLQRFESPSAFSIALKRLVNPQRKADDGWKTVKYNGRFLDVYKLELAKRRLAGIH